MSTAAERRKKKEREAAKALAKSNARKLDAARRKPDIPLRTRIIVVCRVLGWFTPQEIWYHVGHRYSMQAVCDELNDSDVFERALIKQRAVQIPVTRVKIDHPYVSI